MSDKTDQEWTEALKIDADIGDAKSDVHIIEAKLIRSYFLNENRKKDFITSNNSLMKIYKAADQEKLFKHEHVSITSLFLNFLNALQTNIRVDAITASIICTLAAGNILQFAMSQVETAEVYRNSGSITITRSVQSPLDSTEALKKEFLSSNKRFSINYYSTQRIEIQIRASEEFKTIFKKYEIDIPDDGIVNIVFSRR